MKWRLEICQKTAGLEASKLRQKMRNLRHLLMCNKNVWMLWFETKAIESTCTQRFIQPARQAWGACALSALGLLLAHSGEGEDFLTHQPVSFYENGCSSGTESRKIVPKGGNERSLLGLQTGCWPKLGSYGKNRIFLPYPEISGPKKNIHFLTLTMFWPRPEKVV